MNHWAAVRAVGCALILAAACDASILSGPAGARAGSPASSNPAVSFVSPAQCVEPGAVCTLQVMVDDAVDSLSCMDISIVFDPVLVECTKVLEGKLYKHAGYPTFFSWETVPPDGVNAIDCLLGYRSYFLSPGELVRFVFEAKTPGICHVSFDAVRLWDIDRVELAPILGEDANIVVCGSTGNDAVLPYAGGLRNYPNPFNPATVLTLRLPNAPGGAAASEVHLDIYSVSGERVRSLFAGSLNAGPHDFLWDGRDDRGAAVATGMYIGVARTDGGVFRRKMVLVH
jgi:hypothetical protein